jgi:hypothetical protein
MSVSKHLLMLALLGALSLPGVVFAQDAAPSSDEEKKDEEGVAEGDKKDDEKKDDEKKDDEKNKQPTAQQALATGQPIVSQDRNWTFSAFVQTSIGQGTFVSPTNDSKFSNTVGAGSNAFNRVNMAYGIGPSYTIGDYVISGGVSWTTWLSQGGGTNEPGETRISDVSFDCYWQGITFESTGTNINLDGGISLPTSQASRYTSQIVDAFLSASVRQPVLGRRLYLIGSISGDKTFHRFTSPVLDSNQGDFSENVLFRANGAENLGDGIIAIDGRNTEYALGASLGANVIVLPGKLNASIGYGFNTFWSYAAGLEKDQFTNPNADPGRGVAQQTSARVGLTYQLPPNFYISAGIRSAQTPKTADNSSFRFPFWNFTGAAANNSSVFASVRFIY